MIGKIVSGFEVENEQEKPVDWKFKIGEKVGGRSNTIWVLGTVDAWVTKVTASGKTEEYRITDMNGACHFVERAHVETRWASADVRSPAKVRNLSGTTCDHNIEMYDSGWTKEEFCTKCTYRKKLT